MLDIQTQISNYLRDNRSKTLAKSDQLTLGELILKLESISSSKHHQDHGQYTVWFDFEDLFPTHFMSWRGSYDELSIGFADDGQPPKLNDFIKMAKAALQKKFEGYKGGEYFMSKHTPIGS